MNKDTVPALCGLVLAGWAYQADNARVLGWAAALTAALLLARPLADLLRRALAWLTARLRPTPGAAAPVIPVPAIPTPPPSALDARINAALDAFATVKRARFERHVRR